MDSDTYAVSNTLCFLSTTFLIVRHVLGFTMVCCLKKLPGSISQPLLSQSERDPIIWSVLTGWVFCCETHITDTTLVIFIFYKYKQIIISNNFYLLNKSCLDFLPHFLFTFLLIIHFTILINNQLFSTGVTRSSDLIFLILT